MTNTKNILIAQRYSDALVSIAKEGKLTYEKISDDLNLINNILTQSKDLKEFLTNPLVSVDDKKEITAKVFSNEIDILVLNFLKVLIDKKRFDTFDEILISFKKALDDKNNISRINVTSAVAMSEESKKKLKIKLEEKLKKNVVLDISLDSNIIAGLVIKIGDNIIDMSLKHKLEDLSKNITR
jgi:F-type H+-transporting ATPase subunit delta